jgi:thiamine pyrophosphokinase
MAFLFFTASMSILIFANGDLTPGAWLNGYLQQATQLIGADGGTRHILQLGLTPDRVIGDLDSLDDKTVALLRARGVAIERFAAEKDETDLELALQHALRTPDVPIVILGALGGRLDQTLANILLLAQPQLRGRRIILAAPHERAWLISGSTEIGGQAGDRVSLIPLGGAVHVVRTTGLAWPLVDETLPVGPTRGVSNRMTADLATVVVDRGSLLCIHSEGGWAR